MNWRYALKAALILTVAFSLQFAGLASAIPYHADHSAHGTMPDCSKTQGEDAPADTADQHSVPCCCDALGLCQPPSATMASLTVPWMMAVRDVFFLAFEETVSERESPPDPFPPRS
jgi:hypothetical protein